MTRSLLQIPEAFFRPTNLISPDPINRTFDLAVSLELAEHLPAAASDRFISLLTSLAPAVLFSAAIPGQGGTEHVNEQWQSSWAERFKRRDYQPLDAIRPRIWRNDDVAWWYRQNTFLYVRSDSIATLIATFPVTPLLDVIHPENFRQRFSSVDLDSLGFVTVAKKIPSLLIQAIAKRFP